MISPLRDGPLLTDRSEEAVPFHSLLVYTTPYSLYKTSPHQLYPA